jgi:hypothetical protein
MNTFQMPAKSNFNQPTFSMPANAVVPQAVGLYPFFS